jgi:hypothetical protein
MTPCSFNPLDAGIASVLIAKFVAPCGELGTNFAI